MPSYDFECRDCYTEVTLEMKMVDYDPAKDYYCPYCHAKLARVILAANFQLVGQGWFSSGGY